MIGATLPQTKIGMDSFVIVHGPPPAACEGTCAKIRTAECRLCDTRPLKALQGITNEEALARGLVTPSQIEKMENKR